MDGGHLLDEVLHVAGKLKLLGIAQDEFQILKGHGPGIVPPLVEGEEDITMFLHGQLDQLIKTGILLDGRFVVTQHVFNLHRPQDIHILPVMGLEAASFELFGIYGFGIEPARYKRSHHDGKHQGQHHTILIGQFDQDDNRRQRRQCTGTVNRRHTHQGIGPHGCCHRRKELIYQGPKRPPQHRTHKERGGKNTSGSP